MFSTGITVCRAAAFGEKVPAEPPDSFHASGCPGTVAGVAPASLLAPFFYGQLLWVTVLGFLVFGNLPDSWTLTGAGIIIASGLYTAHRERVRRKIAKSVAIAM